MQFRQKILPLSLSFPLLFSLLCVLSASESRALELEACDEIYSRREKLNTPEDERLLRETLACLQSASGSKAAAENSEHERFDRMMIVLSALLQSKTSRISDDLSVMKNAIEKWRSTGGTDGVLSYWRGVHLSFECEHLDRGKALPTTTVKNLGKLVDLFKSAADTAPATHHHGPDRVLGILYGLENSSGKALPAMFGGDTKKAEGYLRKAYAAAPKLSANALNFARILIKNGKRGEAEPILKKLVNSAESDWNPYESVRRFPRPETRADIARAKSL